MTVVRKYGRCPEGLQMKNLLTCLVVCVLSGVTFATTWTVDDDGKADFDNIQAAVDAASDGDEIVVEAGTWQLADGTILQAGLEDIGTTARAGYASVAFDAAFER